MTRYSSWLSGGHTRADVPHLKSALNIDIHAWSFQVSVTLPSDFLWFRIHHPGK